MARRAGLSEEVLVKAAVELIDAEGLGALSLARLAERLGVKSPSLYKHISGLEGLQLGISLWGLRELGGRMAKAAIGRAGDEAITAIAQAYRAFAKDHPGIYPMIAQSSDRRSAALDEANAEVLAIIQAVLAPYGLEEQEALHAIRGLRSFLHGFVSLEAGGGFGMPIDIDSSFKYLMEMILRGLRPAAQ